MPVFVDSVNGPTVRLGRLVWSGGQELEPFSGRERFIPKNRSVLAWE